MIKEFTQKDIQALIEKAIEKELEKDSHDYLRTLLPKLYPYILENIYVDIDHRLVILKAKSPFYIVMDIFKTVGMETHGAMANNEFRMFCDVLFDGKEYVLAYPNNSFEYYHNGLQKRIGEKFDNMADFG